jgi:hypothetical protein
MAPRPGRRILVGLHRGLPERLIKSQYYPPAVSPMPGLQPLLALRSGANGTTVKGGHAMGLSRALANLQHSRLLMPHTTYSVHRMGELRNYALESWPPVHGKLMSD